MLFFGDNYNCLLMNYINFSILSWNVFGFVKKKSKQHMKQILRRYSPDIVFVLEPRTQSSSASLFWDRVGYECVGVEEAMGIFSGRIWALAKRGRQYSIIVKDFMHQCYLLS